MAGALEGVRELDLGRMLTGIYNTTLLADLDAKVLFKPLFVLPESTWGRGDSNPYALRHMILSHARLPIPTLPHIRIGIIF